MARLSRRFLYRFLIPRFNLQIKLFPIPSVSYCGPATPSSPCELLGLGCSDFARHYFRNHGCFLFLWVLRWFTSPGSLHTPMYSAYGNPCSHGLGSPIRIFPDHRLLAPPRDFSQLATSFFAYLRQGIPTHALSSLTIKLTPYTESVLSFHYLRRFRFALLKNRSLWSRLGFGSFPLRRVLMLLLALPYLSLFTEKGR
jgi:hypothetical protein